VKQVRSDWSGAVLVCGKCSKKLGGGFGPKGRERLAKALRGEAGFGKGRKADVGVVEVKCLGLCPKNAVTVVDTRRPGEWLVVAAGDDVGKLAARFS
jgi:predicted metal-binding protein